MLLSGMQECMFLLLHYNIRKHYQSLIRITWMYNNVLCTAIYFELLQSANFGFATFSGSCIMLLCATSKALYMVAGWTYNNSGKQVTYTVTSKLLVLLYLIVFNFHPPVLCSLSNFSSLLLQQRSPGKVLFDLVCVHLNLTEGDYFGLEYQDQRKMTVRHKSQHHTAQYNYSYYTRVL